MATTLTTTAGPWYQRSIVLFCLWFYALAVWWGLRSVLVAEAPLSDMLATYSLALCLRIWATTDARERRDPIPQSQQMWFLLLATLVVPGYVLLTRGWMGLVWLGVHVVGWVAVIGVTTMLAAAVL